MGIYYIDKSYIAHSKGPWKKHKYVSKTGSGSNVKYTYKNGNVSPGVGGIDDIANSLKTFAANQKDKGKIRRVKRNKKRRQHGAKETEFVMRKVHGAERKLAKATRNKRIIKAVNKATTNHENRHYMSQLKKDQKSKEKIQTYQNRISERNNHINARQYKQSKDLQNRYVVKKKTTRKRKPASTTREFI